MPKTNIKILKEKINLYREELEQIILPDCILTEESLRLSKKLDKLIVKYYKILG